MPRTHRTTPARTLAAAALCLAATTSFAADAATDALRAGQRELRHLILHPYL